LAGQELKEKGGEKSCSRQGEDFQGELLKGPGGRVSLWEAAKKIKNKTSDVSLD